MPNSINAKISHLKEGKLTKSQKKLIEYFEAVDQKRVIYMSITDLAAATGVAEATVLRFCRSLGYNGYQDFRLGLAQGITAGEDRTSLGGVGYIGDIADAYANAMELCRRSLSQELIKRACSMISEAKNICCFGVGHSYLAALELHNRLMTMGILTYCERCTHLQNVLVSSRGEQDLIIIFSVSGCSKDTVEAAELARACGMKVLVITCSEKSPLTRYADLVLSVPTPSGSFSPCMSEGKILQLFMVDVLCMGIHLSDKPRFDNYVARSSRATVSKLI